MQNEYSNIIKVIGEIDTETLKIFLEETDDIMMAFEEYKADSRLIKQSLISEFDRITIEISSNGGCVDCGNAMLDRIDEMREMGIHVDTHTKGFAYSMAFILHCYGERRSAGVNAKFMNHATSSSAYGFIDKMKKDIEFYAKCDEQFDSILLKNTHMGKDRIEKAHLVNDWMFYDEAIELGIVNVYEGLEETEEEINERFMRAIDIALETFIQTFGEFKDDEEDEARFSLCDGLAQTLGIDLMETLPRDNESTELDN